MKFYNIYKFYADGFKQMRLGKTLWLVIFVKLIAIFIVIKFLFFGENLDSKFATESEKSEFVYKNLIKEN